MSNSTVSPDGYNAPYTKCRDLALTAPPVVVSVSDLSPRMRSGLPPARCGRGSFWPSDTFSIAPYILSTTFFIGATAGQLYLPSE